jgi:hypothetical protein
MALATPPAIYKNSLCGYLHYILWHAERAELETWQLSQTIGNGMHVRTPLSIGQVLEGSDPNAGTAGTVHCRPKIEKPTCIYSYARERNIIFTND